MTERNRAAMARANSRYDRNHEARVKPMGHLLTEGSKFPDHSPLEERYRNAYNVIAKEDRREDRATSATTNALNQEILERWDKSHNYDNSRGQAQWNAQRALLIKIPPIKII